MTSSEVKKTGEERTGILSEEHKGSQSSFFEAEIEHILNEEDEITMTTVNDDKEEHNNDDYGKSESDTTAVSAMSSASKSPEADNALSSSTIIESLHQKVDILTSTNLKLTVQSHNLLEDLENCQKKEVKLNENISLYNHEHENLNLMLQRRVRKIHSTEEEFKHITGKLENLRAEKATLAKDISEYSNSTEAKTNKISELKDKYHMLLDSHEEYRSSCLDEIQELRQKIEVLRNSMLNTVLDVSATTPEQKKDIGGKLHHFKVDASEIANTNILDDQTILKNQISHAIEVNMMKPTLDLYKVAGNVSTTYAADPENEKFKLPEEIQNSTAANALDNELKLRDRKTHFVSYQSRGPSDSPLSTRSPLMDVSPNFSRATLKSPGANPYLSTSPNMNSSTSASNSSNNTPNMKNRRSFYSSTSIQLPGTRVGSSGTLPGMRKTSSDKNIPPLATSEKNVRNPKESSPLPGTRSSKPTNRRNRRSVLIDNDK